MAFSCPLEPLSLTDLSSVVPKGPCLISFLLLRVLVSQGLFLSFRALVPHGLLLSLRALVSHGLLLSLRALVP